MKRNFLIISVVIITVVISGNLFLYAESDITKRSVVDIFYPHLKDSTYLEILEVEPSENPEEDYKKAKSLFHEIAALEWRYENLVMYDQVIKLAKAILLSGLSTQEQKIQGQYLIFGSFQNQVEIPQKYIAFESYIKLVEKHRGVEVAIGLIEQEAFANWADREITPALVYFSMVTTHYPDTQRAKIAECQIGKIYSCIRQYDKAIPSFKKVINKYPKSALAMEARSELAFIYLCQKKIDEALAEYDIIIEQCPGTVLAEHAVFQKGICQYREGNSFLALKSIQNFIRDYPKSAYVIHAEDYVKKIKALNDRMMRKVIEDIEQDLLI